MSDIEKSTPEMVGEAHISRIQPNSDDTDPSEGRAPQSPKAHLFVTVSHWSMVLLIVLAILSGMRLGWGYVDSHFGGQAGWWSSLIGSIAPAGTMFGVPLINLHVILAFAVVGTVVLYFIYLRRSRTLTRLRFTTRDVQKMREGVNNGNFWRNKQALWSANLLVYWVSFLFIVVLLLSGAVMYWPDAFPMDGGPLEWVGGYTTFRFLHGFVAYLFIPYAILHSVLQWCFGRFWTIFKARLHMPHLRAGFVGMLFGIAYFGWFFAWSEVPDELIVERIPSAMQAPVLDGDPNDAVWKIADSQIIRTVKGKNNLEGHVDVAVKAVHDGKHVYFQFRWKDPDASYKRFPLRKTVDGWEVLQTAFDNADENVYYEDKLSVYITDVPNGNCANTCHIGSGPHAERGDKHGLHFTHGEIGDVWHWKSVRTNNMAGDNEPGYTDDQYIGPPTPMPDKLKADQRYTGGYDADPKTGGGYRYNFIKITPPKNKSDVQPSKGTFAGAQYQVGAKFNLNLVQPIKLPAVSNVEINGNPKTSEENATWWIRESEGVAYDEKLDKYPVGALLPNIIVSPFQGDRADVKAKGKWEKGYWTLETKRVLDTGSKYDVAFNFNRPVYITVATYNRTQTRHGEHISPIKVVLRGANTKPAGTN